MTKQDNTGVRSARRIIPRLRRVTVITLALLFVLQMLVASCPIPEWLMEWLSCSGMEAEHDPRYVVVLGHDIPSQAGLICAYYAAESGRDRPGMTFIIAMPTDDNPDNSSPGRIRDELVLRGIPGSNILFESAGLDTHQQAVFVRKMLADDALAEPLLLVTSPSHMRRALLCFRKQGFTRIMPLPTCDISSQIDLGPWVFFRYTFWARLEWQATIARELTALVVYKLRGWI
jgi:uncharacterized SAM-binding protein YcdF (DUF218 family)